MPGTAPFRKDGFDDGKAAAAYQSPHGLREMYTRENTERRRAGSHTLRRYLTTAQDKLLTAKMVKVRDEYDVANNDDVVVAFVQDLLAQGKEAEVDPKLAAVARKAVVRKRARPGG